MKRFSFLNGPGKNGIFRSYFLSYLLIGFIPLLLSLWGYVNYAQIVREEISTSQSHTLSQLKYSFDSYVKTVKDRNHTLAEGQRITDIVTQNSFDGEGKLDLRALHNELAIARTSMDFCSEIAVFLYESDYIITDVKQYAPQIDFLYFQPYKTSKEDFLSIIDLPRASGYRILDAAEGERYILIIQHINSYNQKDRLATVVSFIPWHKLSALMTPVNQRTFYWIDPDNQILTGDNEDVLLDHLRYDSLGPENTLSYLKLDGTGYVNSYLNSDQLNLRYGMLMPKSFYFEKLYQMQKIIIIQVLVTILIAFLLAYWCSRRNYRPIARISAVLQESNAPNEHLDFDRIQQSLDTLVNERQSVIQAKTALLTQQVTAFLKGWNPNESALQEALNESVFSIQTHYIILAISYQDVDSSSIFEGISSGEEASAFELLRYAFRNIFEETVLSAYRGVVLDIDGMHIALLNLEDQDTDTLSQTIFTTISLCQETLNLTLCIGASDIHCGITSLKQAYSEAVRVLSYNTFWEDENSMGLLFFSDADNSNEENEASVVLQLNKERELYSLLLAGDLKQAQAQYEQLQEDMMIRDIEYLEVNRSRALGMADMLFRYEADLFGAGGSTAGQEKEVFQAIAQASSLAEARQQLDTVFDCLCQRIQEKQADKAPAWLADITSYIDKNFMQQDLSVSVLAGQMNMNLAYIGRTFKHYMGYSINDYIHLTRIHECKRLLSAGCSVRRAAEETGYIDSKSLIRIFKKYEGITPGQYQSLQGKQLPSR